ncbi:PAS domain-containing sensor histidine kinase [Halanaeroarchaeum sulfurireducens]|uniref:histidine kinase n=1 Tax=Halanaeroarchaeum sulfurireducens TaxID=1604004 RepID=A0A0F7PDU4_9EURY|nr:PAS domain-containing sensor histidine kinase [Halanaeroarchaeum sulfurireducens]AKH98370.1 PAS/PAC sensor signal transduction histidine kinase [Halanaeroarchaeum sulfurireducens]
MESDAVTFNEQWAEMLGLSLDEIEPTLDTWMQRVHPEDIDEVRAALEAQIAGESDYYDTEHRMQTAGGEWKWIRDIGRVVERDEDNEPIRAVGIHIDITNRKEREQQIEHLSEDLQESLQQLKVIDRVLRHNFHNAMNVILGYAENIQETSSGAAAEDAAIIIERGEQLISAVDKQREITNLLSEPEPSETIDLGEVIDARVAATREQYPEAQITVESSDDRLVRATKSIDRALTELLTNAVVHSDQAEPVIEVTVEDRDDTVAVRIADDGPGIPDMERKIVTGEAEIEPLYHSSGMGLWLVKLIVQKSGGSLAFEENEPRGSIVSIRLPTAAVHDGDE